MNESITPTTNHFSPAASLATVGVKLSQLDLFGPIRAHVHIKQKTVKHKPIDELTDAFISMPGWSPRTGRNQYSNQAA